MLIQKETSLLVIKNMRIFIFAPFFINTNSNFLNGFIGGSPEQVYKLAISHIKDGNDVAVCTLKIPGSVESELYRGIKIIRIGEINGKIELDLNEVGKTILDYKPDVYIQFFVGSGKGEKMLELIPKITKTLPCKVLVRFGSSKDVDNLSTISKLILNKVTTILVNSTMVSSFIKKVPNGKYRVVENKVDVHSFKKVSDLDKLLLRKKYKVSDKSFVVLFVGRFVEKKGVLDLTKALNDIPYNYRILGFFVGEERGDLLKGKIGCLNELQKLSKTSPGRFKTIGPLSHDVMPEIYNLADLFCLPSKVEGLSNALLEAEACGLDLLVSNIKENIRPSSEIIHNLPRQIIKKYTESSYNI